MLFFGCALRGNPGSGGAGACVVGLDTPISDYRVVWSAAMSHAHQVTTSHQAEYQGRITELRATRVHRCPALEIVGDSAVIIHQVRDYSPPKNSRLLRLYAVARRLADQVDVCRWSHHLHATNKMADSLTNPAMDQAASSQALHPTGRAGRGNVLKHLTNDLRPWLAVGGLHSLSVS
jgi:ribonuclease HI